MTKTKTPTRDEIRQEMEAYNADEIGLDNPITMDEAEHNLLNSDKYHYIDNKPYICKAINSHVNAIADILADYSTDKPFNALILRHIKGVNRTIRKILFPLD